MGGGRGESGERSEVKASNSEIERHRDADVKLPNLAPCWCVQGKSSRECLLKGEPHQEGKW